MHKEETDNPGRGAVRFLFLLSASSMSLCVQQYPLALWMTRTLAWRRASSSQASPEPSVEPSSTSRASQPSGSCPAMLSTQGRRYSPALYTAMMTVSKVSMAQSRLFRANIRQFLDMAHAPGGFSAFPPAAGVFPLAGGEAEAAMEVREE